MLRVSDRAKIKSEKNTTLYTFYIYVSACIIPLRFHFSSAVQSHRFAWSMEYGVWDMELSSEWRERKEPNELLHKVYSLHIHVCV